MCKRVAATSLGTFGVLRALRSGTWMLPSPTYAWAQMLLGENNHHDAALAHDSQPRSGRLYSLHTPRDLSRGGSPRETPCLSRVPVLGQARARLRRSRCASPDHGP